jgi:hydroxymethylbilane synthase
LANPSLIIGSRGSPLALTQAETVRAAIIATGLVAADDVVVKAIRTTGDRIADRPLRDVGGKALFTKEIETAMLEGRVQLAVHSLKDVETFMPDALTLAAVPERVDPRDALIAEAGMTLDTLPHGAIFGTSSLRRQSQVLARRPDIKVRLLRGNVGTRIDKVRAGEITASALAIAGLKRLGRAEDAAGIIDPEIMLPAVGQGILGLQTRRDDKRILDILSRINHAESFAAAQAERAMLEAVGGDCFTPIGGYATIEAGRMTLRGRLLSPDGRQVFEVRREGPVADAEAMGLDAGGELRRTAGDRFFDLLQTG